MTLWVLKVTRSLRTTFALRGRTPELRKSLTACARQLRPLITVWPKRQDEALALLARTRSTLENLLLKLPAADRPSIEDLVKRLRGKKASFFSPPLLSNYTETELWDIFQKLQGIVTKLEQIEKDAPWD